MDLDSKKFLLASLDMEDAHTQLLSLDNDKNAAFFAVYDGHGGSRVAEYAGMHLHERIVQHPAYSELVSYVSDNLDNASLPKVFYCFQRRTTSPKPYERGSWLWMRTCSMVKADS